MTKISLHMAIHFLWVYNLKILTIIKSETYNLRSYKKKICWDITQLPFYFLSPPCLRFLIRMSQLSFYFQCLHDSHFDFLCHFTFFFNQNLFLISNSLSFFLLSFCHHRLFSFTTLLSPNIFLFFMLSLSHLQLFFSDLLYYILCFCRSIKNGSSS